MFVSFLVNGLVTDDLNGLGTDARMISADGNGYTDDLNGLGTDARMISADGNGYTDGHGFFYPLIRYAEGNPLSISLAES